MSPEDIRAAAEVHRELGPEYSDAVVASFIDRVDREVAARVAAQLAAAHSARPVRQGGRRTLLKGVAIGALAGGMTIAALSGLGARPGPTVARPIHANQHVIPHNRLVQVPRAPRPPQAPAQPGG